MKLRKIVAVILCIAIFVLSAGCSGVASDPVAQVIDAINSSEYLTANEIYYEKISGNLELEKDVENQIADIISSAIDSYNSGDMTYDEVELILEVVERADIYSSSSLSSSYSELADLQTSKNYYAEAVALEESGEYLDAYAAYEQVSSDDTNYESAQSKREEVLETLLDSLITEADELVANGEYETAQTILLSYLAIYIEDDEYWAELDLIYTACMDAVIADAEALVAEGNYSDAYDALYNEYDYFDFEGEELYDAEVTKVYSLWEAAVFDAAEEAFGSDKDYEAAILVLQRSGLSGDNIDAKIAEYQEYAPVALKASSYTQKGYNIQVNRSAESIITDVSNNVYDDNVIQMYEDINNEKNYIIYYLGAEYSKFTGTLYRPYITLRTSDEWSSSVKIYGDGVLLYETSAINSNTYDPYDFEVDVTGVRELKIVIQGYAATNGLVTKVVVTNMMLSK